MRDRSDSRGQGRLGALIIAISLTLGGGIVVMLELARVLRAGHPVMRRS